MIISGRNENAVGKPLIYSTSKSFMDYFGINSADELPKINEILMEEMVKATSISDRNIDGEYDEEVMNEETISEISVEEITETGSGEENTEEPA